MDFNINKEKKDFLKSLNNSKEIYRFLENEIKNLFLKKIKTETIKNLIEKELNKSLSLESLRDFIRENKKQWIKELKNKKGDEMQNETKIIAMVNFKGGVGKSTLANILDLENKIIINLDDAQDAEKINISETTANFGELKEYGITDLKDAIDGAKESGKKYVILDTPGDIKEFVKDLSLVDYFIIPFTPGERAEETTLNTIDVINTILDEIVDERKDRWCIVLNKYNNDNQLKELEEIYNKSKKILGNRLICKSHLKYSAVVPTIERKKVTIEDLIAENPIAYGVFRKRVKEFNQDVKKMLGV
jgi:cellulose biosynthesis protein BcsQ